MRLERDADSDSVDPAGNQVEHAGWSQVNIIRSSDSGIDRIAAFDGWEGEWFLQFPLLRRADLRLSRFLRDLPLTTSDPAAGHGSAAATQRFDVVGTTAAGICLLTRLRRGCHRLEGSEDQVESERELVGGVVSGGEERCGGFVEVGVLVGG